MTITDKQDLMNRFNSADAAELEGQDRASFLAGWDAARLQSITDIAQAGWVLVPDGKDFISFAMIEAIEAELDKGKTSAYRIYQAMVAARPAMPNDEVKE